MEAEQRIREVTEPFTSVYIGGGTPSLILPSLLDSFIHHLKVILPLESIQEFTIESNPGTLTEDFIRTCIALGINRFSLGMQSADNGILKNLGRIHSYADVINSVRLLNQLNVNNYNLDLMFGIPSQTMEIWTDTLNKAISLKPAHISAYGLIPEEGTPLFRALQSGATSLPSPDLERDMYDTALTVLEKAGYRQYEISNFARENRECIHNIGYWDQTPYMGLGVSAASMQIIGKTENGLNCVRKTNPETLDGYMLLVKNHESDRLHTDFISPEEARFETMMLALRMNRGISESRFFDLHRIHIDDCYGPSLKKMEENGLMIHQDASWKLTRRGMDIQNSILLDFMDYRG